MMYPTPLLAEYTDDEGYTIYIYAGAVQGADIINSKGEVRPTARKGTKYIQHPDGRVVETGYWMDWPEEHWDLTMCYRCLSIRQRAQLECVEQSVTWGLREIFELNVNGTPYTRKHSLT